MKFTAGFAGKRRALPSPPVVSRFPRGIRRRRGGEGARKRRRWEEQERRTRDKRGRSSAGGGWSREGWRVASVRRWLYRGPWIQGRGRAKNYTTCLECQVAGVLYGGTSRSSLCIHRHRELLRLSLSFSCVFEPVNGRLPLWIHRFRYSNDFRIPFYFSPDLL